MALSPIMCAGGHATEQSAVVIYASGNAAEHSTNQLRLIPIIEVAFNNGMWWSIPQEMSAAIYARFTAGQDAGYTWDWGKSRPGSWVRDGVKTSISRYTLDFTWMEQTNIDNKRKRSFRIAWVLPDQIEAHWTGEFDDFPKP